MNSHHILQQLSLWLEEKEVQDTIIIEIMLFDCFPIRDRVCKTTDTKSKI